MASATQSTTAQFVPGGVNRGNMFATKAVVPGTVALLGCLQVAYPDNVDLLTPMCAIAYTPATTTNAAVYKTVYIANWDTTGTLTEALGITSASPSSVTSTAKNVLLVVAPAAQGGAALAAGDIVQVFFYGS